MFEWLDRMRQKPEHVRLRVALVCSFLITALIILVWLSLFSLRFDQKADPTSREGTESSSPFAAFGERFRELFSEGGERLTEFKERFNTIEYSASVEGE